jgi:hypothetical protein
VGGWLWLDAHFMTQTDAEAIHEGLGAEVSRVYYELKIDTGQQTLHNMETLGIDTPSQQREYDLLKLSVQNMSEKLMELKE